MYADRGVRRGRRAPRGGRLRTAPHRRDGPIGAIGTRASRRYFANTILAAHGEKAYRTFTHGGGFFRNFFATLKAGTESGALRRLFVTGVSPITLDDVTSGFNIGENVSLDPRFNELLGFTEAEVREVLERYRGLGVFRQDVDEALGIMREWYDGYRFPEDADTTLYNTGMVLYT